MISFYDDDIDVEYTYIPATGDGWHEEKFGEYVEIDAVYRDGEEITCELTDEEFDILQLLEVRLYGASATPKKFGKMLPMLDKSDRLCGQYTFNGAQQTGRFSSRGVQVHNLTRAHLGDLEEPAIEFILELENPHA